MDVRLVSLATEELLPGLQNIFYAYNVFKFMLQNNFHNQNTETIKPPRLLPVLEKAKTVYKKWMEMHRNIERTTRFGLGLKIDNLFLDLLELLRKAVYTPVDKKIILLDAASEKVDAIRFFLQILWENRLCPDKQYISLESSIQNIGRMIGGWKKGLISKTSGFKPEERKH